MRRTCASYGVLNFALVSVWVTAVCSSPWATPAQEALDELHDAEILRAVITSMAEYNQRRASHRHKRAESSVCYGELGCFQASGPFSYLDMLPSPPAEVGTRFLVYGGRARSAAPLVDLPAGNMTAWGWTERAFNASAPTKVIVHGFGSSCSHVWVYEMRSALMAVEDCNVVCVDWEGGAAVPNYVRAAANTRLVGKQVAMLLAGLQQHAGLSLDKVHLIGFSLGAHAAGFAGSQLRNVSRITGLDPAGPLFESQDPRVRLDSSDAKFVDVIHSNGENLILGGLGSWQPMGHADFYPNGGRMQKGCSNLFVGAVTDIIWSAASEVEGRSLCNHRRAYKFFTDSVSPRCHFPSFPCGSYDQFMEGGCFPCSSSRKCGNMGYYADRSHGRGTLYLITRDEEPFCAHQYHLRLENAPSEVPVVSYGKLQVTLIGSNDINETFVLTMKDDEELKSGSSITRMLVPHPILQEPVSMGIMYTAYSGWISSGLPTWVVNKLTLTDSFGKSLSVCRKALVLESGFQVVMRLYPGECHPPRNPEGDKGNWTTPQPPSSTDGSHKIIKDQFPDFSLQMNSSKYSPTPVEHVGDELIADKQPRPGNRSTNMVADLVLLDMAGPMASELLEGLPWQPLDYSSSNRLDDSRAFASEPDAAHASNNASTAAEDLVTATATRQEVKEPVLGSTTSRSSAEAGRNLDRTIPVVGGDLPRGDPSRPEITEPVLSPRQSTTTARPSNVRTRHVAASNATSDANPPPPTTQAWRQWEDQRRHDDGDLQRSQGASPMVVQFFSHRLASMLAQAERYARTAFVQAPSGNYMDAAQTQRRAKLMTTSRPVLDIDPRGSTASYTPKTDRVDDDPEDFQILVPYSYVGRRESARSRYRYIPLSYPSDERDYLRRLPTDNHAAHYKHVAPHKTGNKPVLFVQTLRNVTEDRLGLGNHVNIFQHLYP